MIRPLALVTAFVLGSLLAWVPEDPQPKPEPEPPACCKTCRKGKACGDSCIARSKDCQEPNGCACDAPEQP